MNFDTVRGHLDAGRVTPRARVTAADLWSAVEVLEAYEGDPAEDRPGCVGMTALATVAAWLRAEAQRRDARTRKSPPGG